MFFRYGLPCLFISLLLLGCKPTAPEEHERLLVGSWTGEGKSARWCITYHEDRSMDFIYRLGDNVQIEEGRYFVRRGGRLTHSLIRQKEPKEIVENVRFFLKGFSADEFSYRSELTKVDYRNRRIDSCENF